MERSVSGRCRVESGSTPGSRSQVGQNPGRSPMKAVAQGCIWISEAEVGSAINMHGAIEALERGLAAEAHGEAANMLKTHAAWDSSTLHAIGAVFPKAGLVGTKTWAHTPRGASPLLILFDSEDGAVRAVIEAFNL